MHTVVIPISRTHTDTVILMKTYSFTSVLHSMHTPVIPVTSGIPDKGQTNINTLRVQPLFVLFVTLTLDCGCTTSNSQHSSNTSHVTEDTKRPLYPVCVRECESETVMSLSRAFCRLLLSVSQLLSHRLAVMEEGRKEGGKRMSAHPVSLRVCMCVWVLGLQGKKGDWSLFENSNEPITVGG